MTPRALPSNPMTVRADEHGAVRVFATDREEAITRDGMGHLIGADVDTERVEVIDTKDIAALGLATYLAEGYGIRDEDLDDGAEALNAIDGCVALIPTSAFKEKEATLSPSPPLRFVGIYLEAEGARPRAMAETQSSRMLPELEPAPEPDPTPPVKRSYAIILVALLLSAALVLWAVL